MKPVIDANVVIHGRNRQEFETVYTVPEVLEEMESSEARRKIDNKNLKIEDPEEDALEKVREKSDEINSPTSDTDERVVALALSLEKAVVSDDKAVQNLASHLDLDFHGYMEEEIEKELEWKLVCSNCGASVTGSRCPRCGGSEVRRKTF